MLTSNSFHVSRKSNLWALLRGVATNVLRLGWPVIGASIAFSLLTDVFFKALQVSLEHVGFFRAVPKGVIGKISLAAFSASICCMNSFMLPAVMHVATIYVFSCRCKYQKLTLKGVWNAVVSRLPSALILSVLQIMALMSSLLLLFVALKCAYFFDFLPLALTVFFVLLVIVASIVLFVMSMVVGIRWDLSIPLSVMENIGWQSALRRSWRLTSGFSGLIALWIAVSFFKYFMIQKMYQSSASSPVDDSGSSFLAGFKPGDFRSWVEMMSVDLKSRDFSHLGWWLDAFNIALDRIIEVALTLGILDLTVASSDTKRGPEN